MKQSKKATSRSSIVENYGDSRKWLAFREHKCSILYIYLSPTFNWCCYMRWSIACIFLLLSMYLYIKEVISLLHTIILEYECTYATYGSFYDCMYHTYRYICMCHSTYYWMHLQTFVYIYLQTNAYVMKTFLCFFITFFYLNFLTENNLPYKK